MHVVPDQPLTATVEPVHRYTTVRPHPAIGMLTPIEHERAHGTGHGLEIIKGGNQPLPQITATRQTSPRKTQGLTAGPLAQGQGHDLDEPGRPFHEHRRRRGPVLDL